MKFWLLVCLIFGFCFALQDTAFAYQPAGQVKFGGLNYLNTIRINLGLKPFTYSQALQNASKNHAYYLQEENKGASHYEINNQNSHFTGKEPANRALHAKHNTAFVGENIALMQASLENSVDALLSAIYHRFGFLTYEFDEIGFFQNSPYFVYLMSNSQISKLCRSGDNITRLYLKGICRNENMLISKESFDKATKPKSPRYIYFPNEKVRGIAYFGGEIPDPLPQCKLTSAPVSIEFNPNYDIKLMSFKIFKDGNELKNTFLLSKANDVNKKLNERQFALFSLLPFEFDAKYSAKVEFLQDNRKKTLSWNFMTKTPENEYFVLKDKDIISMQSGKIYDLFFVPKHCNDIVKNMKYLTNSGAKIQLKRAAADNIFTMMVSGKNGDIIKFQSDSHNITIVVKD